MKYSDESLDQYAKEISESYIKNNKVLTDDLLESHIENFYENDPIPIEQRPTMWVNVSNLLNKHYESQPK
jgi:hypothetical protein